MGVLSEADATEIYRNGQRIVLGFPKTHGTIDCDNVITHFGKTKAFLFTERWAGKKNARRGCIFLATHRIMRKKFGDEEALEYDPFDNSSFLPSITFLPGGLNGQIQNPSTSFRLQYSPHSSGKKSTALEESRFSIRIKGLY